MANPVVRLVHHAYFGTYDRGERELRHVGGNRYSQNIGPFPNGTEVWLAVAAFNSGTGFAFRADAIVQVGVVPRGSGSGLDIANASFEPAQPQRGDTILVRARIVSNATLGQVTLLFVHAYSPDFGVANRTMVPQPSGTYEASIENPILLGYIYPPGTVIVLRVAATDTTSNTATSGPLSITIR